MSKIVTRFTGSQALLVAAFLFAFTNVLIREMAEMWGDQAQVAARFMLVWIILMTFSRIAKAQAPKVPRAKLPTAIAYSLIAGIAILFFTLSVQTTTIANTLFTSNAAELFIAFMLGTLILREKLTARKIIALSLALAGLAFYADSILSGSIGILFGLLGGATTAVCNLLAKKLKGVDSSAVMRLQFGVGSLLMIVLTAFLSPQDIIRTVSIEGVIATICFALILIVATKFVLYGFQNTDINIASVMLTSQLAFGAVIGFVVYQEMLTGQEIVSGLLILCAALVASVSVRTYDARKKRLI